MERRQGKWHRDKGQGAKDGGIRNSKTTDNKSGTRKTGNYSQIRILPSVVAVDQHTQAQSQPQSRDLDTQDSDMSAEVVPPSAPAAVAVVAVELVRLMQLRVVIQKDQRVASSTLLEKLRRP